MAPMGAEGTGAIYADASGEVGWAAWTLAGSTVLLTGGRWSDAAREGLLICEKELFASAAGAAALSRGQTEAAKNSGGPLAAESGSFLQSMV